MTLTPIAPSAGVCFSATSYAVGKDASYVASGGSSFRQGGARWANATNIEFIAGYPQKIAGWTSASSQTMKGIPRAQANWRGTDSLARQAIGTTNHLYVWQTSGITDVTPATVLVSGTLSGAVSTINNSAVVAIADSAQTLQNGDWVFLSAASAVGGITLDGWYPVSARTGSGYNVTTLIPASSTAGPGGGTLTFEYPRITLTDPFTTVNNATNVTVHDVAHGASLNQFVVFSGASAVGGLTLNGEFQITSIVDADNYTITSPTAATSGATGGGSVSTIYLIQVAQTISSALPVWGQTGVVWGAAGGWGTSAVQVAVLPDGWTLSAYGGQMLACPVGGTIYVYDPIAGGRAYPLLNAPPTGINAMFVTPERFVVALGTPSSPLQMAWSDQNDNTIWVTTPTNTANTGRNLIGGSYFVGGLALRNGLSLVFTDKCVFEMNYSGGQEIYDTPQIGDNCGLVSPWAVCAEGGVAFWNSDQDWWTWNGGVSALSSDDVRASVFQATGQQTGINRQQLGKCAAVLNRGKRQVRFFLPSASASENDGGMIYQYDQQCWSPLSFGRSSGTDANLFQTPMSCDQNGNLYYDESGVDANGQPLDWTLQLADLDISNGDKNMDIFGFIPDFQILNGTVQFTALAAYYPDQSFRIDGPWTITPTTNRQDLRLDGKLFSMQLVGSGIGNTMRLGASRLDVQPSGARR